MSQQELDRIVPRIARLGRQREALDVALEPYGNEDGDFDLSRWASAFTSNEPQDIAQVSAVTGLFESLVNHAMELLQSGGRLTGLAVSEGRRPSGPDLVRAVVADEGLTRDQGTVMVRLYRTRNVLQHTSFEMEADRVHADIELLRKWLGGFVKSYADWLSAHGTELFPGGS